MYLPPPGPAASAPTYGTPEDALLLGLDIDLFAGPAAPETARERATRLAVAHAVLEELREAGRADEVSALDAQYAAALLITPRLRPRAHTDMTRSAA